MSHDIDLGDEHTLRFFQWSPDRSIESNRVNYEGVADIPRMGALVAHKKPDGSKCMGAVHFDIPEVQALDAAIVARGFAKTTYPRWQVVQWEPLTLVPSVLCSCGDHGFIREGKWVRA